MTDTRKTEPLADDPQLITELLGELDKMAAGWAAYLTQTGEPNPPFQRAINHCGESLAAVLTRLRGYAQADD